MSRLVPVAEAATAATTTSASAIAAASTRTSTTATTIEPAAPAPFRLWPRFVDIEGARPKLSTIRPGYGFLGLFIVGHFHKGKTARLASIAVAHNGDVVHLPVRRSEEHTSELQSRPH